MARRRTRILNSQDGGRSPPNTHGKVRDGGASPRVQQRRKAKKNEGIKSSGDRRDRSNSTHRRCRIGISHDPGGTHIVRPQRSDARNMGCAHTGRPVICVNTGATGFKWVPDATR